MTPDSFTIRPLGYSDLPQVMAIERRAFTTPWSLAMFVLELAKPSGLCLAALDRPGRLTGYLVLNIAVEPVLHRRGIARALMRQLIERAGRDSEYTLEVRTSNAGAIALYEQFDFRPAGTRPRYYRDNGEDAVIMWRTADTTSGFGASR
jgi:ribosomal-protein-alanine N-acetyltransferase